MSLISFSDFIEISKASMMVFNYNNYEMMAYEIIHTREK